jgi:ubiquinone/menaquinone biosynthesis C-methylase UbiE
MSEAGKSPFSLQDLLSQLPQGACVLDLGCGGGTFNYSAYPHLQISALDEKIPEKLDSFPNHARFEQGGASSIPSADGIFDVVIVNFAFEHFPDATVALREIDRVTKDHGWVWISMPNAGSFEDQLYRNLYAGGGHLQRPTAESFLRQAYAATSLKMMSLMVLPAGFTFLANSEPLRHLTWAIVDALRRTVGLDARTRSGYIFILQKFASAGPGFREYLRCCSVCGSPDGILAQGGNPGDAASDDWHCRSCGAHNAYPSNLQTIDYDEVSRAIELQWQRYPETKPETMRALAEERTRWAQQLEKEVAAQRAVIQELQAEVDARGRWGQELDAQLQEERRKLSVRRFVRRLRHPISR